MQASLSTNMAFILLYRVDIRNRGPVFGVQTVVVSLCYTSIAAGVVGTVAFQQVHDAPHAESGSQRHNKGLQGLDRG